MAPIDIKKFTPYTFTVPITNPRKLSRFEKLINTSAQVETERTFTISAALICTSSRIAKHVQLLPNEIKSGSIIESMAPIYPEHIDNVVYIIAAAIHNYHTEPPIELIKFIKDNFDQSQLLEVLFVAFDALQLDLFFAGISVFKGQLKIIKPETETI